jgi:DNA-binding IclR family transcriptional regulator
MPRPAPAVHRTVQLLNFLAAHPGEGFTLSQLAQRLGFNKTTCHTMLAELIAARYVLFNPVDRSHRLGSALVPLGHAATVDANRAVTAAEVHMVDLRDRFGVSCVATTMVGEDVVTLARRDARLAPAGSVRVGDLVPAIPPVGRDFMAWASYPEIEEWLSRLGEADTPELRARYRTLLDGVRRRGYVLNPKTDTYTRLGEVAERLHGAALPADVAQVIDQLQQVVASSESMIAAEGGVEPRSASAPVFGPAGRVLVSLTLVNFPPGLDGAGFEAAVAALLAATRQVTEAVGGAVPSESPAAG